MCFLGVRSRNVSCMSNETERSAHLDKPKVSGLGLMKDPSRKLFFNEIVMINEYETEILFI